MLVNRIRLGLLWSKSQTFWSWMADSHVVIYSACKTIYKLSNSFPKSEIYGLTSQIRRASVSVSANIAEGFKKKTKPDKAKFMNIAQSSLEECRYYLILSKDLGYNNAYNLMPQLEEISKLLEAYRSSILNSGS